MTLQEKVKRMAKNSTSAIVHEIVATFTRNDWALWPPKQLFHSQNPQDCEGICRRMAIAVYVGDNTVLCRTLGRFKMYVSTRDHGLAPHLIADGYWEMWVTRAMAQIVQPGMVCIDAGANIGYYTLLMADLVGAGGQVIAAEPVAGTRAYLKRNVDINGFKSNTTILEAAFGERAGEVTLYTPPDEPKNSLICETCPDPTWEKTTAPLMRIDDLALPRVDFIKIDVEGAEINVWHGMQEAVDHFPNLKIMMEVNCKRYGDSARNFIESIGSKYPLRHVDYSGSICPLTTEEIYNAPDDVMLYLERAH